MKHKYINVVLFTLLVLFSICMGSCKDELAKKEVLEWLKKSQPEYDRERQVIYYKEELDHDIRVEVAPFLYINGNLDFYCQLSFFNYGDDLRLYNKFVDDIFSPDIGDINCVYLLNDNDNIQINHIMHNEKYGDWSIVNLEANDNFISDVFMTPLAMKAYKEKDLGSFIFIQFITQKNYMNVLFYGGPTECMIIDHYSKLIRTESFLSHSADEEGSGSGKFWKSIHE